jgi:demethylmenaquinone methyltransferase/2-methoxy-6-polyprenyl-1,4-benzoquinol methylase
MSDQISFKEGNADNIPFGENFFDWAWSADCVGYGPWQPIPLLKEMKRVVRPGGIVALIAWSSEQLLPGYPYLEANLKATKAGLAPFQKDKDPEKHFLRASGWFRELGFKDVKAEVFCHRIYAPLNPDSRKALISLFEMRWPGVEKELSEKDRLEFKRLCTPSSPDFILNHPDYYGFFTYSMFWGKVNK